MISQAQQNDFDSLKKYSYRVDGVSPNIPSFVDGTGCFFRKGGQLYFITAKHVLSGCTMKGKSIFKDDDYPDVLLVSGKSDSDRYAGLAIPIRKIRDSLPCLPLLEDPDIIAIPVENKWHIKVYSIENFISSPIDINGEVKVFGFPSDSNYKNNRRNFSAGAGNLHWFSGDYDLDVRSSIFNNLLLNKNKKIPIDSSLKGYSGSPVFFKEQNSNQWKIAGVLSGTLTTSLKQTFFVVPKISIAISDINK